MNKWILPLALLIFFEAVADIFAKNWSIHKSVWIAVTSLTFYLIANSFWLFALKMELNLVEVPLFFLWLQRLLLFYSECFSIKSQLVNYKQLDLF